MTLGKTRTGTVEATFGFVAADFVECVAAAAVACLPPYMLAFRPPFQASAAKYIHEQFPQPWDAATEKLVVFMLGVTSHYIADINWQ